MKHANEVFFQSVISITNDGKYFIWQDYMLPIKIQNNKYICDTRQKRKLFKTHTTAEWYNEYCVF